MSSPIHRPAAALIALIMVGGCDVEPSQPQPSAQPLFAADFEQTFVEVRGCRPSIEHDLEYVRLLVHPDAVDTYRRCVVPSSPCSPSDGFTDGALLVKAQYLNPQCTDLLRWTAVQKDSSSSTGGGWRWQEVSADRQVTQDGAPSACTSCHAKCEDAFDLRCVMDP
jgi:hypothetical protein